MNKKDWTDDLPGLMEGYSEPEPEGLWEAVRAEVGARRRATFRGWYAAGALAAAAALALFVVFKPFRTPTPVPASQDDALAELSVRQTDESALPATPAPELAAPEASALQQAAVAPVAGGSHSVAVKLAHGQAGQPEAPAETAAQTESSIEPTVQSKPSGEASAQPDSPVEKPLPPEAPAEAPESAQPVSQPQAPGQSVVPGPETPSGRKPSRPSRPASSPLRVQLGVTTTGLLAQAAPQTIQGVNPLSVVPATRSISTGNSFSDLTMTGRNKAGVTEVRHRQSARFGAGIRVQFLPRWGVESGFVGTRLQSSSETKSGTVTRVNEREYDYWGIPLYLHYTALDRNPFSLYLAAGPMIEFARSCKETEAFFYDGKQLSSQTASSAFSDRRCSLNLGAGLQWAFFEHNALFVQPGVSLYLPRSCSPDNFYSAHPLAFQLTLGYRLILF